MGSSVCSPPKNPQKSQKELHLPEGPLILAIEEGLEAVLYHHFEKLLKIAENCRKREYAGRDRGFVYKTTAEGAKSG